MIANATLAALLLVLNGATPAEIVIDDFEDVTDWRGLDRDPDLHVEGAASGRWDQQTTCTAIRKNFPTVLDATGADALSVWMHSAVANGAQIEVVFDSENSAVEGWDYYRYPLTVDWQGWRHLWIPLNAFQAARTPVGWNAIRYVSLNASGWSHEPLADTILRLDDMRLTQSIITNVTSSGTYDPDGYTYHHDVTLMWKGTNPLPVDLAVQLAQGSRWQANVEPRHVELASGADTHVQVDVHISRADMDASNPLHLENAPFVVLQDGRERDKHPLELAVPLPHRPAPRLLVDSQGFTHANQRASSTAWASMARGDVVGRADDWPARHNERYGLSAWSLPPEGGQWTLWYVCPDHGVSLTFTAPNYHVCPIDQKAWTGWPYDQVIFARRHSESAQAARDLGLAHQLTGDITYAQRAAVILLDYADAYSGYPLHDVNNAQTISAARATAQTLDESIWLIPLAWAYDLVSASGVMNAAELAHVENDLLRAAVEVIRVHNAGKSNWQSWHNGAIAAVGFAMEDPRLSSVAIHGPGGFLYQMAHSVTSDGFWYEGSWGYHFFALDALTKTALMAERAGVDLFANPSLRNMYSAPVGFAMPDLTLPSFNDSGQVNLAGQREVYEVATARFPDALVNLPLANARRGEAALFWGPNELPSVHAYQPASLVLNDAGYVVLRAGALDAAHYLALDFGPHGEWHGHFDKLGFVSFARGTVMGLDPGTQSYAAPTHDTWDKTTVAHNTLVVDESVQAEATGHLIRAVLLPDVGFARADAGDVHPGVARVVREMALVPEYALDVVQGIGLDGNVHKYDLIYHNGGTASTDTTLSAYADFPSMAGYQHLAHAKAAVIDGDAVVRFDMEGLANTNYGSTWGSGGATGTFTMSREQAASGSGSGKLHYDLGSGNGYVLFTSARLSPVEEVPSEVVAKVYGDGSGHTLKLRIMDSADERFVFSVGAVDWTGWREVRADNPAGWTHYLGDDNGIINPPLASVVLEVGGAGSTTTGNLYVDDIVVQYPVAGSVLVEDFEWADRSLTWHVLGEPQSTLVMGDGLGPKLTEPVPFAMVRRTAKDATFVSMYEPHGATRTVQTMASLPVESAADEAVHAFDIRSATWMDWWLLVGQGEARDRVAGDGRCDGVLCYARRDGGGSLVIAAVASGSRIEQSGAVMVSTPDPLDWLRVEINQGTVKVQSQPEARDLRIHAPDAARVVDGTGAEPPWSRDGEFVVVRPLEKAKDEDEGVGVDPARCSCRAVRDVPTPFILVVLLLALGRKRGASRHHGLPPVQGWCAQPSHNGFKDGGH